jgi:exodeoxyribonuclease-3
VKIATWNVNSLKVCLPRLLELLAQHEPDVLCIQETKTEAAAFPVDELQQAGYRAAHHSAGVGRGSRSSPARSSSSPIRSPGCRASCATTRRAGSRPRSGPADRERLRFNGREVGSPTFAEKLAFLDAAALRAAALRDDAAPLLVGGDFNVTPADLDVHDPAAFEGSTYVTADERSRIDAILGAGGLVDAYRHLHPEGAQHT